MLSIVLTLVIGAIALLLFYNWWRTSFLASNGVPSPPALPFVGHFHHLQLNTSHRYEYIDQWYYKFKHSKFIGFYEFFKPNIFVCDTELIKNILIKDFDHFVDRRNPEIVANDEIFGEMLSIMTGERWKAVRSLMTPTFSSGKMKIMYPLVEEKVDAMLDLCDKLRDKPFIDMKDLFGRYTMDVIASCAFGIECNSLTNSDAVFPKKADTLFSASTSMVIRGVIAQFFPRLSKILKIQMSGPDSRFFADTVDHTIKMRASGKRRGDFLDLMLDEMNSEQQESTKWPIKLSTVVSQSVLFLIAGYDTTANCLTFASYLLAKYPKEQERLRKEISDIKEAGNFNYYGIMESKLLEAIIGETLRLYPIIHFVERECTKGYKFPGTELEIPQSTMVSVPTWSLQHDPAYWKEPEEFIPDRFLPENKADIIPGTYLPFGLGPRNCLGMRFAQMEIKLALSKMILKYEFQLAPGFTEIQLEKHPNLMRPGKNGVRLVLNSLMA